MREDDLHQNRLVWFSKNFFTFYPMITNILKKSKKMSLVPSMFLSTGKKHKWRSKENSRILFRSSSGYFCWSAFHSGSVLFCSGLDHWTCYVAALLRILSKICWKNLVFSSDFEAHPYYIQCNWHTSILYQVFLGKTAKYSKDVITCSGIPS